MDNEKVLRCFKYQSKYHFALKCKNKKQVQGDGVEDGIKLGMKIEKMQRNKGKVKGMACATTYRLQRSHDLSLM